MLNDLGAIYIAQGRKEEAVKVFQKSNELFPHCFVPWYSLIQEGEIQEAQKAFDRTIQADTNASGQESMWVMLGDTYRSKNFFSQAIDAYNKAININDKNAASWRDLSTCFFQLKQYDDTIRSGKKAIELNPNDASAWNILGATYYDTQKKQ